MNSADQREKFTKEEELVQEIDYISALPPEILFNIFIFLSIQNLDSLLMLVRINKHFKQHAKRFITEGFIRKSSEDHCITYFSHPVVFANPKHTFFTGINLVEKQLLAQEQDAASTTDEISKNESIIFFKSLMALLQAGNEFDDHYDVPDFTAHHLEVLELADGNGKNLLHRLQKLGFQKTLNHIYIKVQIYFSQKKSNEFQDPENEFKDKISWMIACNQRNEFINDINQESISNEYFIEYQNLICKLLMEYGSVTMMEEFTKKMKIDLKQMELGDAERSLIERASASGNLEMLRYCLKTVDMQLKPNEPMIALFLAVKNGHKDVVKYWLEEQKVQVNITTRCIDIYTFPTSKNPISCESNIFTLALFNNHPEIFQQLIESYMQQPGINIAEVLESSFKCPNKRFKTFVSIAIEYNQAEIVAFLLLNHYPSFSIPDVFHHKNSEQETSINKLDTPLRKIFMRGNAINLGQILILLSKNNDFKKENFNDIYKQIKKIFCPSFFSLQSKINHLDGTLLQWAIICNQVDEIKRILDTSNVDLNYQDRYGRTPLDYTKEVGNSEINILLKRYQPVEKLKSHSLEIAEKTKQVTLKELVRSKDGLGELWMKLNEDFKTAFIKIAGVKLEDMASPKAVLMLKLAQYIETRGAASAPEYKGWMKGSLVIFGHKFNISKKEKISAATALWEGLGEAIRSQSTTVILPPEHLAALSNGELSHIYKMCLHHFPEIKFQFTLAAQLQSEPA